ncbi:MAG: D-alanyl-D-alanine carboxypeptidase/D-alanyl-D-alanine-endopeptidase [Oscillatoriales cyanobacterium]|uniref:D-alanyl-D-alanine carboxypeptidase/D-alanyl-D-alanine-endopeptidase n=1 Tax=Microcoleus anatoxicus PTRS2 TaxID=2705321 RepID=A0ABU8YMZ8_9CYAN|nr:MAG: D-alanyl-D-alanine carboxypeptidase/D-alanyl-D-alanine-endopeptidase [Oscillatoriales cyanobacterium]TAD94877.1 MAG: D-alanyl-D-alanine carboxypeptidase/D-alanyl-D-alanine-endopeptidase [Oscillatoriales cyanobacterium]TAE05234.1 MAG: D-alanyl-D-alanine carboxypeptidase/D-alanyl-D-alanine-endopeptidase [Oscillatoriales cyanobacterium]TAF02983.1 MAG: D-alanyl-D-alanine carboxypeptidase/D-alanyl-D-alanine-endopeptidase [Oscillatoriales cyanobacterium]TAF43605.1 MAG: D-alanyl-D-alanine carb
MIVQGILIGLLTLVGTASAVVAQIPAVSGNICAVDLGAKIDAIANRAEFSRSRWGILIQPLSSTRTLYSRDAQKYFIPASNVKLLTTAAALQKLGADFRIETSVYSGENGNLYIAGRGDPSIAEAQLQDLAQQLKRRGISRVNELIGDDSYFQGNAVHPNWEWEDAQAGYGAPINSLMFNQNAIELILSPLAIGQPLKVTFAQPKLTNQWQIENKSVTVGQNESEFIEVGRDFGQPLLQVRGQLRFGAESESAYVAVVNPAHHFLQQFQQSLEAEGIAVKQALVASNSRYLNQKLATIESPPMAELVKETNRESNNVYAEVLLRLLGKSTGKMPGPQEDTMEVGLKELKTTLTQLGVNPDSYVLVDGSGLSRHNLISPEALVQTLRLMANSPSGSVYRASLPVAGESGTLKNRFTTPNRVILQAKTGTLNSVAALSGYVEVPNYEPLVFSIMVNQSDLSTAKVRSAIDEIVLLLNRLSRC